MLSWRAPVFLLSVYLLFLLAADCSARKPTRKTSTIPLGAEKCNGGNPVDSLVTLELFTGSSSRGSKLECSSGRLAHRPTKVVMHGFKSSGQSTKENGWVEARKRNENLIIVDWSGLAKIGNGRAYKTAATCALEVGKYLAKCLNDLNVDPSSLHLFGHSLGAHGVGMAGRELANKHGRKPSRVTGMDPAGPGFTHSKKSIVGLSFSDFDNDMKTDIIEELKNMKIGPDSGNFVDIVHTNIGVFGAKPKLGHVDYYVNGGGPKQSKCIRLDKLAKGASHSYANKVVVASLLLEDDLTTIQDVNRGILKYSQKFGQCQPSGTEICPNAINGHTMKFDVAKTRNGINTRDGNYFLVTPKTQC